MRLALYGSLMRGFDGRRALELDRRLRFEGPCRLRGALYDLGAYPGLVEGPGEVLGELYAVLDPGVFAALDEFEGFDPGDSAGSLYVRVETGLIEPAGRAWTYIYNRSVEGRPRIDSGSWAEYVRGGDGKL